METMHTDPIAAFLARFPPFDGLEPEELASLTSGIEARSYDDGDVMLLEDGTPTEHLFVIREGSAELMHQGEVVDLSTVAIDTAGWYLRTVEPVCFLDDGSRFFIGEIHA